jgi:XTP/dITP diphosphohydrolase
MCAKIVLASSNQGKIDEFNLILAPLNVSLVPQDTVDIPPHEETGLSFIENAISKARWASRYAGLPAIGDDSGLVVPALLGEPGIYSRRYAGEQATDDENMTLLLSNMEKLTERNAFFYCAIAYVKTENDPSPLIATGQFHGEILRAKKGEKGFGYDPLFYLPTLSKTVAEIEPTQKNKLSHRAKACQNLINQLRDAL